MLIFALHVDKKKLTPQEILQGRTRETRLKGLKVKGELSMVIVHQLKKVWKTILESKFTYRSSYLVVKISWPGRLELHAG